jgi:hypothetical protein
MSAPHNRDPRTVLASVLIFYPVTAMGDTWRHMCTQAHVIEPAANLITALSTYLLAAVLVR